MLFPGGQGVTGRRRVDLIDVAGGVARKHSHASKSHLHDFSFPTMNWGSKRIMRCVKPVSEINGSATRLTNPDFQLEPKREGNSSYSLFNLHPMLPCAGGSKDKEAEQGNASSAAAEEATAMAVIPWNLRKRRAARYAQSENERNRYPNSSRSKPPLGKDNPGNAVKQRSVIGENGRQRKFSVSLSRKEIEEDFYGFKGMKPNRRPKKRPRAMQKQLNALFPGSLLSEITKKTYKVDE